MRLHELRNVDNRKCEVWIGKDEVLQCIHKAVKMRKFMKWFSMAKWLRFNGEKGSIIFVVLKVGVGKYIKCIFGL